MISHTVSPMLRAVQRGRTAVLMFHGFTDVEHTGCENIQHKHLHVDKLGAFLDYLSRHYLVIHLDHLMDCIREGIAPPKHSVVLTFDDGFLSNYTLAFPLLKRFQAPAIIYLATQFVDEHRPIWTDRVDFVCHEAGMGLSELRAIKARLKQMPQEQVNEAVTELEEAHGFRLENTNSAKIAPIRRSLNWDHVREMQKSGLVRFGAHTHTHKILGRCREETIREELQISKSIIERETGRPCDHFCYPNGSHGDFSELSERLVIEAGFQSSLTTISGRLHHPFSPYLIPRFGVTNQLDVSTLDLVLNGIYGRMAQLRSSTKSRAEADQRPAAMATD